MMTLSLVVILFFHFTLGFDDASPLGPPCDLSKPFFSTSKCSFTFSAETVITLTTPGDRSASLFNPGFELRWFGAGGSEDPVSPFSAITVRYPRTVLRESRLRVDNFWPKKLEVPYENRTVTENLRFLGFPRCGYAGTSRVHDGQKQVITLTPRPGLGPIEVAISGFMTYSSEDTYWNGIEIMLLILVVSMVGILTTLCFACPCFVRRNSLVMQDATDKSAFTALQAAVLMSTLLTVALISSVPAWATVLLVLLPTAAICAFNVRQVRQVTDGSSTIINVNRSSQILLWLLAWTCAALATYNYMAYNSIYYTAAQCFAALTFATITVGLNFTNATLASERRASIARANADKGGYVSQA